MPAVEIAREIDAGISDGVVVFGSLPPHGRDLDLLARPAEHELIAAILRQHGYVRCGLKWASFGECVPSVVELVPAQRWRLAAREQAALFAEAEPIGGFARLRRPAPHHRLLTIARRHARSGGTLGPRLRRRIDDAVAEQPRAWALAAQRAPLWNASSALRLLQRSYESRSRGSGLARAASWIELASAAATQPGVACSRAWTLLRGLDRRPRIVAFSGLDGAGKSSQARALQENLERVGIDSVVIWAPAKNRLFRMDPALKHRLLRLLNHIGRPAEHGETETSAPLDGEPEFPPLPSQRASVTQVLGAIVALSQVLALRRAGRGQPGAPGLLIYDRYVLDSIVYLGDRWGAGRSLRWQSGLIKLLARRPAVAYLLEINPEVAFARKQDFPVQNLRDRAALYRQLHRRLGVRPLDATRSMQELHDEICREVWLMIASTAS